MINYSPFMKSVRNTMHSKYMALATEKIFCCWIRFLSLIKCRHEVRTEAAQPSIVENLNAQNTSQINGWR